MGQLLCTRVADPHADAIPSPDDYTLAGGVEDMATKNLLRGGGGGGLSPLRMLGGRGLTRWVPKSKSQFCLLLPDADKWTKNCENSFDPTCLCSK